MDKYRAVSNVFFFQAEDGIRDLYVTGVQTCALPISEVFVATIIPLANSGQEANVRTYNATIPGMVQSKVNAGRRSEERRVGKECRSRWTTFHCKNKSLACFALLVNDDMINRVLY